MAATAEWSPELTVNHPDIDRQHLEVFRSLGAAAAAIDAGPAALDRAVAAFADALVAHLAAEEALMNESRYPERGRHKVAHELFLADVARFRDELRGGAAAQAASEWLGVRIPEWLRFHIRVNDAPLGEYLARRRAQKPGEARRRPSGRHLS